MFLLHSLFFFFFFNDTATTEIYTLSLHDALPISGLHRQLHPVLHRRGACDEVQRSEEHTSELQSHSDLVCRLLLEKKKQQHPISVTDMHSCNAAYQLSAKQS